MKNATESAKKLGGATIGAVVGTAVDSCKILMDDTIKDKKTQICKSAVRNTASACGGYVGSCVAGPVGYVVGSVVGYLAGDWICKKWF